MTPSDLLPLLAEHKTLGTAPRREREWLAAHGTFGRHVVGEILQGNAVPINQMWIVLAGAFEIHVDRGLGPRRVAAWGAGEVAGLLPYSRMKSPPGDIVITEATEIIAIPREDLPELTRECPVVTERCVHVMLDRARVFNSSDLHDEKMASLGRIAAGLAHELNNPASAATRSAKLLIEALDGAERAAREMAAAGLTVEQLAALDRTRAACADAPPPPLSPLARADREEALGAWLDAHGADAGAAAALADTPATTETLDILAAAVGPAALDVAIRWVAACCTIRALTSDIERSTSRIHALVGAVKRFTYMDRQQSAEVLDPLPGLRDTVTLLAHKARARSVDLSVVGGPLPQVKAIGSDLNQIWTNLLDNALDAVPEGGRVRVTAGTEPGYVVVRIEDDGPGVPADLQERIFDPFFTTKPVGQGTGLGLDIARRLARRNGGDLSLESRPGRTVFQVAVPLAS